MSYYFAYGSNADPDFVRKRANVGAPCGFTELNLNVIGKAILPHHSIAFSGYSQTWHGATATIVKSSGKMVKGMLYETNAMQERAISCFEHADGREGRDTHKKINVTVQCEDGKTYNAYAFIIIESLTSKPSAAYLKQLQKGYRKLTSEEVLKTFIRSVIES